MEKETVDLPFVKALNEKITDLCKKYALIFKVDLVKESKEILTDVQTFASWFLATEEIGVNPDEKNNMNSEMILMLKDINEALEHEDSALMYDALENGIAEYLRMFIPEDNLDEE